MGGSRGRGVLAVATSFLRAEGGGVSDEFDLSVPGRKMMLELISPLNFVN